MSNIKHLHCNSCGKQVSTGFIPQPTETPDKGLIIRAWIECPECMEKKVEVVNEIKRSLINIGTMLEKGI